MLGKLKALLAVLVAALVQNDPSDRYRVIVPLAVPEKLLARSKQIQRTLGTRSAAGYLRNRQVGLDQALRLLCGSQVVRVK